MLALILSRMLELPCCCCFGHISVYIIYIQIMIKRKAAEQMKHPMLTLGNMDKKKHNSQFVPMKENLERVFPNATK